MWLGKISCCYQDDCKTKKINLNIILYGKLIELIILFNWDDISENYSEDLICLNYIRLCSCYITFNEN